MYGLKFYMTENHTIETSRSQGTPVFLFHTAYEDIPLKKGYKCRVCIFFLLKNSYAALSKKIEIRKKDFLRLLCKSLLSYRRKIVYFRRWFSLTHFLWSLFPLSFDEEGSSKTQINFKIPFVVFLLIGWGCKISSLL